MPARSRKSVKASVPINGINKSMKKLIVMLLKFSIFCKQNQGLWVYLSSQSNKINQLLVIKKLSVRAIKCLHASLVSLYMYCLILSSPRHCQKSNTVCKARKGL